MKQNGLRLHASRFNEAIQYCDGSGFAVQVTVHMHLITQESTGAELRVSIDDPSSCLLASTYIGLYWEPKINATKEGIAENATT